MPVSQQSLLLLDSSERDPSQVRCPQPGAPSVTVYVHVAAEKEREDASVASLKTKVALPWYYDALREGDNSTNLFFCVPKQS